MTKKQIDRAYRKLFDAVTRYDGYQMFGYDEVTMRIIHPGFIVARDRLREMYRAAAA